MTYVILLLTTKTNGFSSSQLRDPSYKNASDTNPLSNINPFIRPILVIPIGLSQIFTTPFRPTYIIVWATISAIYVL